MAKTPAALVLMLHPHEHLSSPTWGSNQVKVPVKEEGANTGIKQNTSKLWAAPWEEEEEESLSLPRALLSLKWHSCLEEMVSTNPKPWKMCFAMFHADLRSIYGWIQPTSSPEFTGMQVGFVMTSSHWCTRVNSWTSEVIKCVLLVRSTEKEQQ